MSLAARSAPAKPTFGRWLLGQADRTDEIGALAKAAKVDSAFPKEGDVLAVSRRLNVVQADSDMHAALEQAEFEYYAY